MTPNDKKAMNIHKITPWISGFTPTCFKAFLDKPVPMKNRVRVSPCFAKVDRELVKLSGISR